MKQIKLKAYGKINLGLDIVGRRENGYHEVRMIMQTVGIYDRLYMERVSTDRVSLETNLAYLPTGEGNLVCRAIELLRQEFHIRQGVHVRLQKFIPVAAGMAGGSTDAAAALVGMNYLFRLRLYKEELTNRGLRLGADVPYCILRGTALSEGIGEKLTPLPAPPDCHILIAKPKASASTKLVYERYDACTSVCHPDIDAMLEGLRQRDLKQITGAMGNVLEPVTAAECPVIEEIRQVMTAGGALRAMMTGSGTTVFGLFQKEDEAEQVREQLRQDTRIRQIYLTRWFHPLQRPQMEKQIAKERDERVEGFSGDNQ